MKTQIIYVIILLLLGFAIGFGIRAFYFRPPELEIAPLIDDAILDSLRIEVGRLRARIKPVAIEKVEAVIETVLVDRPIIADVDELIAVPKPSFELVENTIAVGDTTFKDFGSLDAVYYFPPVNKFDFLWIPEQPRVIVKFLPQKPGFWQRKGLWFGLGVSATVILVYALR